MIQEKVEDEEVLVETLKNCSIREDDPKAIFSFPYLTMNETISHIKTHGKIVFIIRGPPNTKKTTLSDMLQDKYPHAVYCSAVKEIDKFNPSEEKWAGTDIIMASHNICQNKVKEACLSNEKIIIIQNTHIKYFEVKPYLEYAAKYDYTVIMSVTLYGLDITTPEKIINKENRLDPQYIIKRFDKFQHVLPMYTGWFLSPNDSEHIRYLTFEVLESLLQNNGFQQFFGVYDKYEIKKYFQPRKVLSCLAAYTRDLEMMKTYYLSDTVQTAYGKMFELLLIGYLVRKSGVIGIVQLDEKMKSLISQDLGFKIGLKWKCWVHSNILQHSKTTEFPNKEELEENNELVFKDWEEEEEMNITEVSFIHLAQKGLKAFELDKIKYEFNSFIKPIANKAGNLKRDIFTNLENGTAIYKLHEDAWLVRAPKKIHIKSIFTGFYV